MRGFGRCVVAFLAVSLVSAGAATGAAPGRSGECTLDLSDPETPRIGLKCVTEQDLLKPGELFVKREGTLLLLTPASAANVTAVLDPANETIQWITRTTNQDGSYVETMIKATLGCVMSLRYADPCRIDFEERRGGAP